MNLDGGINRTVKNWRLDLWTVCVSATFEDFCCTGAFIEGPRPAIYVT